MLSLDEKCQKLLSPSLIEECVLNAMKTQKKNHKYNLELIELEALLSECPFMEQRGCKVKFQDFFLTCILYD